jgi:hypothetical protein
MTRKKCILGAVLATLGGSSYVLADGGGDMEAMKNFPADQKAFLIAAGMNDPQAKLDALRKFQKDYPKSVYSGSIDLEVLEVLAKNFPSRAAEINTEIEIVLKNDEQGSRSDMVASYLAENDALLARAEKYENQALRRLGDEAKYTADTKSYYQANKIPIPDEKKIHEYYLGTRARYRATLGGIYVKEGKTEEGQAMLKESFQQDPSDYHIASQLAAIELKAGHDAAAFDYLVPARLNGNTNVEDEQKLERLYKKTHGDSLAGFQEYLDQRYEQLYPEPTKPELYTPGASRSDRVVFAELITGAACPPCVGADIGMDQVIQHYSRKDVVVLASHRQSPRPDPMANWSSIKQSNLYDIKGIPSVIVDGVPMTAFVGGLREGYKTAYDNINAAVEKELEAPSEAAITVSASLQGDAVQVHATAERVKNPSADVRLQIALVEQRIRYNGENGIRFHSMVLRNLANLEKDGFAIQADGATNVDYSFDVAKISRELKSYLEYYQENNDRYGKFKFVEFKDAIDANNLAVVAFIQDSKTKHILQSSFVNVSGASSPSARQ